LLSRVRQHVVVDEVELCKLLANTYYEVSGEYLEPEVAPKNSKQSGIPDLEVEQASLMVPKPNKSNLTMIIIEAIDYYLYETSFGFDRMGAITRGIGCLLGKLARLYSIPCLVTASVNQPKDYSKYNLSPWMNFTADSILINKTYLKTIDGIERRSFVKPLIISMKAPFCLEKGETLSKDYKVRLKVQATCLEDCGNTIQSEQFFTEKTFRNG
jgi:hypothetical protein